MRKGFCGCSVQLDIVVDLGCGAGRDFPAFEERGVDYLGVDASEGMLTVARERFPDAARELHGAVMETLAEPDALRPPTCLGLKLSNAAVAPPRSEPSSACTEPSSA